MFKVINFKYLSAESLEQLLNELYSNWMICGMSNELLILTRPVWTYHPTNQAGDYQVTLGPDETIINNAQN